MILIVKSPGSQMGSQLQQKVLLEEQERRWNGRARELRICRIVVSRFPCFSYISRQKKEGRGGTVAAPSVDEGT